MARSVAGISTRIRHYVTLTTQLVPLVGILVAAEGRLKPQLLLVLAPLALSLVGPLLELAGKRVGRALTLTGLALQILGLCALLLYIFRVSGVPTTVAARDLIVLLIFALPLGLFMWNWVAGREEKEDALASPSS